MDARAKRKTILVVSLPGNAEMLASAFERDGEVHCALDESTAVRLFRENHPDVVLIGYHFDRMRPYRVIHALRETPRAGESSLILFCMLPTEGRDFDGDSIRDAYRELGCLDFVDLRAEAARSGPDAATARLRRFVLDYLEVRPTFVRGD